MTRATLARHSFAARVLHALHALLIIVLLVTGLALGDVLAGRMVLLLGGHSAVNATHQFLGLAFVIAWTALLLVLPNALGRLLRDAVHFRRRELRWPIDFLRFSLWPRRYPAPFHDGRLDPAQRVIFVGIIAAATLLSISGVYLYLSPPFGRAILANAIRLHIAAAWLLVGCVCIHVAAGSGLLRTHRGLVTAMFGNGRVAVTLARALWPGWALRQTDMESATPPPADTRCENSPPADHSTENSVGK